MQCPNCKAQVLLPGRPAASPRGGPEELACPECGAALLREDENEITRVGRRSEESGPPRSVEDTLTGPPSRKKKPAPVLGLVIVYSEPGKEEGEDTRWGKIYPLRAGELLFVGRSEIPVEALRFDGTTVAPTYGHLFPSKFTHISRRHLTLEMEANGPTLLTDTSGNGFYLLKAKRYGAGRGSAPFKVHRLEGDETIVLGMDMAEGQGGAALQEQAARLQLRIVRPEGAGRAQGVPGPQGTRS